MRAPPGVDLRGLLAGSEYSGRSARVRGSVTFVLFSGACLSKQSLTRRLKVAIRCVICESSRFVHGNLAIPAYRTIHAYMETSPFNEHAGRHKSNMPFR